MKPTLAVEEPATPDLFLTTLVAEAGTELPHHFVVSRPQVPIGARIFFSGSGPGKNGAAAELAAGLVENRVDDGASPEFAGSEECLRASQAL